MNNNLLYQFVSQANETEAAKRSEEMQQDVKRRREDYTQMTDEPEPNKFKKEDYLSTLPIDCLLDVLARIDHNDLDELATVNKEFCELTDHSRAKAVKVVANELAVLQINAVTFSFSVSYGIRRSLQMTLYDLSEKKFQTDLQPLGGMFFNVLEEPQTQVFSELIIKRAKNILHRFDFKGLVFNSISLDNHFLDYFEYIASSRTIKSLMLMKGSFEEPATNARERFLSILLSSKPESIMLMHFRPHIVNEKFLSDYSEAVASPDFIEISSDFSTLRVTESFAEPLSKFKTLRIDYLLVDTNWLIASMINRLRLKTEGRWVFNVNNLLDQVAIRAVLEEDLEYVEGRDPQRIHFIKITETNHEVMIDMRRTHDPTVWKMIAQFTCYDGDDM